MLLTLGEKIVEQFALQFGYSTQAQCFFLFRAAQTPNVDSLFSSIQYRFERLRANWLYEIVKSTQFHGPLFVFGMI